MIPQLIISWRNIMVNEGISMAQLVVCWLAVLEDHGSYIDLDKDRLCECTFWLNHDIDKCSGALSIYQVMWVDRRSGSEAPADIYMH
jgi:hypothetical protein